MNGSYGNSRRAVIAVAWVATLFASSLDVILWRELGRWSTILVALGPCYWTHNNIRNYTCSASIDAFERVCPHLTHNILSWIWRRLAMRTNSTCSRNFILDKLGDTGTLGFIGNLGSS